MKNEAMLSGHNFQNGIFITLTTKRHIYHTNLKNGIFVTLVPPPPPLPPAGAGAAASAGRLTSQRHDSPCWGPPGPPSGCYENKIYTSSKALLNSCYRAHAKVK